MLPVKHICEPNFSFCLIIVEKKNGSGVKIRVGRVIGNTLIFLGGLINDHPVL